MNFEYYIFVYLFLLETEYIRCDKTTKFCRLRSQDELPTMVCKIAQIEDLEMMIHQKYNVRRLDVSRNDITNISKGSLVSFRSLQYLSLAYNKIKVLKYEAFYGLDNLTILNLTMNPLSSLSGNLTGLLPSLSIIDATGITDWTPETKLFKLRMFRQINGLSLSTHAQCINCNMYRDMSHNETRMLPRKRTVYRLCRAYHFTIRAEFLPLAQTLNNSHLDLSCYNECSKHFYTRTPVYHCWYIVRMASKVQGVFGGLAAILNFVAFVNIITSKQLRKSVSMCFVCNMALSDCLMGIYIVAISTFQNSSLFEGFLVSEHAREICSRIGFLWMLSNTGSVITTLLLTLERYLTIVYSLRPEIRIPRRMAFACLCICWFFAAFLGIFALQNDFYSSRANAFCLPTGLSLSPSNRGKLAFTLTNGILVLTFYLLSFTFYVHIYVAAKRTAQNAGVQRESKLAKKIALLVFTNMAFFFLPVLCIGIIFILEQQYYSIAVWSLVNLSPMLCVSINACCNPILHAFRHESFRKIVKARLVYLWRIVCRPLGLSRVFEASMAAASYHHRTADDKAMDGENQRNGQIKIGPR